MTTIRRQTPRHLLIAGVAHSSCAHSSCAPARWRPLPGAPSLLAACAALACAGAAHAQGTPAPQAAAPAASAAARTPAAPAEDAATRITVTGQRAALQDAMRAQQQADNIVSIVRSDGIGKLPDINAAEALQRLPGVSVQRDQGEGRYISVRGLGSDLNLTTINGALVPSPEGSRRGVALDVLPAGLIRSLEVSKTLTPDQDANSLGGTVNVKTLSAFDLPGRFASLDLGGGYDGNSHGKAWKFGLVGAERFFDNTLGLSAGVSAEDRKFGSDNVESGASWVNGRLGGIELRNYLPERKRRALAFNVDYKPVVGSTYFVRAFGSEFSDEEVRDRLTISDFSTGTLAEGQTATVRGERRVRARKYTQSIESLVLGTEQRTDTWKVDLAAGISRAQEDTPEALNDGRFRGTANFAGVSFTGTEVPRLNAPASLYNPASYALNDIRLQARLSKDRERHVRADIGHQFDLGSVEADVKFGGKVSRRTKTNDTEAWRYNSTNTASPNYWGAGSNSLSAFVGGPVDYLLGDFGPGIDPDLIRARIANLPRAGARLAVDSVVADYQMHEYVNAAYVMASSTFVDALYLMTGVRYEGTQFRADGSNVAGSTITPVSRARSYHDYLPTLQAKYSLDKATNLRTAVTKSVVRAVFSQLSPGVNLISATEATIGNPDLAPLRSTNFDLGVERALGGDGAVSVYLFAKDIKDFAYTVNLAGTGQFANYTTATSYANGDSAKLAGVELSYQHALRMLPGFWNGLIVGANATFTHSKATISEFNRTANAVQSRGITLPNQAARVVNLTLGYEAGDLSTRLAANSKSHYIQEIGAVLDQTRDRVVDSQTQVDFSVQYRVTKGLRLGFEVANLNNEKLYVYQGAKPYNAMYEQYGRTYKVSLQFTPF